MKIWLFDIDGTLIETGGAGQAAYLAALEEIFSVKTIHGSVSFAGRTDRAIAQDLFKMHGLDNGEEGWRRFVPAYLGHLERTLCELEGRVLPGVEVLLSQLADCDNVAIGLLTGNMERGARMKLKHYGIEHHFPFGGFGDEHFERDEVARSAVSAADRFFLATQGLAERSALGMEPSTNQSLAPERIVIGDTPHDVRCGRAIGATVIAVATGFSTVDELAAESPDLLVESLEDLSVIKQFLN